MTRNRLLFLIAVVVIAFGCIVWLTRTRPPEMAEVTGIVTLNGKPADLIEVKFMPDPARGESGPVATCYTDETGRYRLRSEQIDQDGAILGTHRVVFADPKAMPLANLPSTRNDPAMVGIEIDPNLVPPKGQQHKPRPSRVAARYRDINTTPYQSVEVRPGTQELNFDLTIR